MSFWGELKRRNVFKVGAAYLIAAWLILQVASITFPALNLPAWALTLVTVFLIIGFIVAIILAWAFELTPEGVKRSENVPLVESITHVTGRKLNYIVTGLLVVAVAYIFFDHFYLDRRARQTEVASTTVEQPPATADVKEASKTIAVLPFADLSPEKDQEYFVDGLSEEILNSLAQIKDLTVIARTSSFSFKNKDMTIQEIAGVLDVENILEGSVRKAGDALRITAQLIKAVDGSHLWSKTYDKEFNVKAMFSVQEDIARAVANELKITLGIDDSIKILGGTENQEAYELYLISMGGKQALQELQSVQDVAEAMSRAASSIDDAIELDPDFALAWALKAKFHNSSSTFVPSDLTASERDAAEQAALKAIEIEPDLADGYFPLGAVKQSNGSWIEAEVLFRKGMARTPVSINPEDYGMPQRYWAVGQLTKCHELLEESRLNDPLNIEKRVYYIWSFGFLGNIQRLKEEYEQSEVLFGRNWFYDIFLTSRICAGEIFSRDEMIEFLGTDPPWSEARKHLGSPGEMLAWLRQIYAEDDGLSSAEFCFLSLFAAYYGDPEFSMDALEKGVALEAQGIFWGWAPVFHEVRQLPRFKEFVREIGLVDYWEQFGWPDPCRPTDDGDFACD